MDPEHHFLFTRKLTDEDRAKLQASIGEVVPVYDGSGREPTPPNVTDALCVVVSHESLLMTFKASVLAEAQATVRMYAETVAREIEARQVAELKKRMMAE